MTSPELLSGGKSMPVRICRAELLEGRCLLNAAAVATEGVAAEGVDAPPAVVAAGFLDWPSPVQRVRFEFSEDVTGGIDWRALRLDNLDTGETIPGTFFGTVQVGPTVAERRWLTG